MQFLFDLLVVARQSSVGHQQRLGAARAYLLETLASTYAGADEETPIDVPARARVRLAIEDVLDEGLPRAYTKDVYSAKCSALFEHVYESYLGDGRSVYAEAG